MSIVDTFVNAVRHDDVATASAMLRDHPELKSRLNDALPGLGFGATVLQPAVEHKNLAMIDLLIANGADIHMKSDWWAGGFGPIDQADADFVPFLLERGAVLTAYAAARLGFMSDLERLVRADSTAVHMRGGDGQTPLHVAATPDIARFLLEHGADLDALDVDHESTPAQYAMGERLDVARYLIERGCRTDILMAAGVGDLALVRRHVDADPNSTNTNVSKKYFPMHNPRAGGTIYNWTLGGHKTAHIVARERGHDDVYDFLMSVSPPALSLVAACELGDAAAARAILAAHPNIAASLGDDERRRIVYAAEHNSTVAVRLMLESGWSAGTRGDNGQTALHWAGFHGNAQMARDILRYAPPIDAEDSEFHGTPIGWAKYGAEHSWHCKTGDYPATIGALRSAGAKEPSGTS
jgi:ankyrin repeat protein